jgi:hypothetical protein
MRYLAHQLEIGASALEIALGVNLTLKSCGLRGRLASIGHHRFVSILPKLEVPLASARA